jgi:hypothetical protein
MTDRDRDRDSDAESGRHGDTERGDRTKNRHRGTEAQSDTDQYERCNVKRVMCNAEAKTELGSHSGRLRTTNYELRTMDYEPRTMNYELRTETRRWV